MTEYTRETQRLHPQVTPQPTVQLDATYESSNRKLQVAYTRKLQQRNFHQRNQLALGLILGSLAIAGAFGYGLTIGGLALATLIVIAFYQAGKDA